MYESDGEDPVIPTMPTFEPCPAPKTKSGDMFVPINKETAKLLSMSSQLAYTTMDLDSSKLQAMNLAAALETKNAELQQLKANLEKERIKSEALRKTVRDNTVLVQNKAIEKLKNGYIKQLANKYDVDHSHSAVIVLRLQEVALRASLKLTEKHRDEAFAQTLRMQQRVEDMEEDVACMNELLQANEDLRWLSGEHKREIQRLHGMENKVDRIDAIIRKSFENADTKMISLNGFYDTEGFLQLLLDRDRSRARELEHVKKQLAEAKNTKMESPKKEELIPRKNRQKRRWQTSRHN
ncbi:hypothetical protein SMACR_06109 [Sordaria macrospora]|uniref:WGS project CABT00000000 data, contig 2.32 n=2 Tax=Sordaria macrospora TaxID=5147 RepID=F7W628_SORMK|nr:uncharacterized protein SMAC_06109 [Sordaria macrospora k-hell]KAA8631442.1 hypothetical protein SMACR_06109 [Sordaria macrospora]KAH7628200.1 hypothetical protein B0T09DRAFT_359488 [Sordaria sp. MPI-SDFR-AT-0083]WPJ65651.1 hypothetical protein SMAC4_06109 [Sordaria macrospora]CCC12966.1 unnamed protein product [Sordaria macrospora k-hell]